VAAANRSGLVEAVRRLPHQPPGPQRPGGGRLSHGAGGDHVPAEDAADRRLERVGRGATLRPGRRRRRAPPAGVWVAPSTPAPIEGPSLVKRVQKLRSRTPAAPPSEGPVAVVARSDADRAMALLEHGHVLVLPDLTFDVSGAADVIYADVSDAGVKNVSYNPANGELKGTPLDGTARERLAEAVARYSEWAEALVRELLPAYARGLEKGRASFRPRAADHNLS